MVDDARMKDIGALLVSRAIADLYERAPVGQHHRGYRQIVDSAGWIAINGESHPTNAYAANVVRIPKGWRSAWSPKAASDNLVARVTFDPPVRGVIPLETRSFDPILSEERFFDLVTKAADRYGLRCVDRSHAKFYKAPFSPSS